MKRPDGRPSGRIKQMLPAEKSAESFYQLNHDNEL